MGLVSLGLQVMAIFRSACQLLLVLLIPLAILLFVRNDLLQTGNIDPYIYTAFIHDYAETASRFPGTYYSTRLAHILPNALAAATFGDYAGYIGVRYLQLVAATLSIYVIARHYGSILPACFVTLFFCSHVWLLRALLWEHYDGTVVVYALVGLALLLPRKVEILHHFGAGFVFAWAINGNPMGLVIAAAYGPTWLIERSGRPLGSKLASGGAAVAGLILGYGLLVAGMMSINPKAGWDFDKATFAMISWIASGGAANWFMSFREIFLVNHFFQSLSLLLFICLAVVAILNSDGSQERKKSIGAFAFVTTMTAIYLIFHFGLHAGALSVPFYLSFSLPACVVALSALLGQWKPTNDWRTGAIFALFFSIQLIFWSNADLLAIELDHRTYDNANAPRFETMRPAALEVVLPLMCLSFVGLFACVLFRRVRHHSKLFPILILGILFTSNALFLRIDTVRIFGEPHHRDIEWDVRNGALYLQSVIAKSVPRGAPVRFWYGTGDSNLDLVQSGQLWLWSRLSHFGASDAQMPKLDDGVRARLKEAKYIAILGNPSEIKAAQQALDLEGLNVEIIDKGKYRGKTWGGYDVLVGKLK